MSLFGLVWNSASTFSKLILLDEVDQVGLEPREELLAWIKEVGWERISCMDESLLMSQKEREELVVGENPWFDLLGRLSGVYETLVEHEDDTGPVWDHILSLSLTIWNEQEDTPGIKGIAVIPDEELEGELRHVKETIRTLKRIRLAAEAEDSDDEEKSKEDDEDDEFLLGLQTKMGNLLQKIQTKDSPIGALLFDIMAELKKEGVAVTSTPDLMQSIMQAVMGNTMGVGGDSGGGGKGKGAGETFGKMGKIIQGKLDEIVKEQGPDKLKDLFTDIQNIFGKDAGEMKETMMRSLQAMLRKSGLPRQMQTMFMGKMQDVVEQMTNSFMSQDGPVDPEKMQEMLKQNMQDMMRSVMQQNGAKMSNRKMQRMQSRGMGAHTDPRAERLERLKNRLRNKRQQEKKRK